MVLPAACVGADFEKSLTLLEAPAFIENYSFCQVITLMPYIPGPSGLDFDGTYLLSIEVLLLSGKV